MRIRWSLEAADDLKEISDYLRLHRPEFAHSTVARIYAELMALRRFPGIGRPSRSRAGCRDLILAPLPYICTYSVDAYAVKEPILGFQELRQSGRLCLLMRVIAAADERAAFDVLEAHLEGFVLKEGELVRGVEARHRQVVARGAKVLADGEDVDRPVGEVAEDGEELVHLFAHADDDAGLGD
jgi:plasmid stabilization system protein ParE